MDCLCFSNTTQVSWVDASSADPRPSATKFCFNETNLARIGHSLEVLEQKINNLSKNQTTTATTVSRDDMIIFGSRFRQLLALEFGENEIYDEPLEYFIRNFPHRYSLLKAELRKECPNGIEFDLAFERVKVSWRLTRYRSWR